jgi:hypothetical protein
LNEQSIENNNNNNNMSVTPTRSTVSPQHSNITTTTTTMSTVVVAAVHSSAPAGSAILSTVLNLKVEKLYNSIEARLVSLATTLEHVGIERRERANKVNELQEFLTHSKRV